MLPGGKFGANAARPKRLRFEVFTIPARIKEHEGRLTACLSAEDDRVKEMIETRRRLVKLNNLLAEPAKSPSAQNQPPALEELHP